MNDDNDRHPRDEALADLLYGEGSDEARRHAGSCERCQKKLERWRGVKGCLDRWEVGEGEVVAPRSGRLRVFGKVAAAAVLVVAGIGIGRSGNVSPVVDAEAIKREVVGELVSALDLRREEDLEVVRVLLGRQEAELAAIRRDLETVAWNAEQRIGSAEEGILQLASLGLIPGEPAGTETGQH